LRTLETFALEAGRWTVSGQLKDHDVVAAPPFEAIGLSLDTLWVDGLPEQSRG